MQERMNVFERACYKAIGERIRAKRETNGLSQLDLAEQVKLTRTSISNIESGNQKPLVDTLYLVAHALGTSIHDLLPARLDHEIIQLSIIDMAARLNIDTEAKSEELAEIVRQIQSLTRSRLMAKLIQLDNERLVREIKTRRPEIHPRPKCKRCGLELRWNCIGWELCAHCEPGGLWSDRTRELLAELAAKGKEQESSE